MYVYVVVCEDLSIEQQAVQACHACLVAGRDLLTCQEPFVIMVSVPDQYALIALSVELSKVDISHRVFTEEDLQCRPTALATQAIPQDRRKHLRHLPLYRASLAQGVPARENAS